MMLIAWLLFVIGLVSAVLLPSEDEWYQDPVNITKYKLGEVIRTRPAPHAVRLIWFSMNVNLTTQVMVRSQTKTGEPVSVVNTVIVPHNGYSDRVLFFQMAQDTADANCAPLHLVLSGLLMVSVYNQFEMASVQLALLKGMVVVLPDHETKHGWWPGGKQSGYVVLDLIRGVVKNSGIVSASSKVVMWGYSGGSIPTKWALGLLDKYAPDLKKTVVGAALGGLVSNYSLTAYHNEGSLYSGLVALTVAGLAKQYPQFDYLLKTQMTAANYEKLIGTQSMCMFAAVAKFRYQLFFSGPKAYAKDGWATIELDVVQSVFREHTMALDKDSKYPKVPVLMYHSKKDEIISYHDSETIFHDWCKMGIELLEFHTDETSKHVEGIAIGTPMVVNWIEDRFNGKPPVQGCELVESKSFLDDSGWSKFLLGKMFVLSFIGRRVGLGKLPLVEEAQPAVWQWWGTSKNTTAPTIKADLVSWFNLGKWFKSNWIQL